MIASPKALAANGPRSYCPFGLSWGIQFNAVVPTFKSPYVARWLTLPAPASPNKRNRNKYFDLDGPLDCSPNAVLEDQQELVVRGLSTLCSLSMADIKFIAPNVLIHELEVEYPGEWTVRARCVFHNDALIAVEMLEPKQTGSRPLPYIISDFDAKYTADLASYGVDHIASGGRSRDFSTQSDQTSWEIKHRDGVLVWDSAKDGSQKRKRSVLSFPKCFLSKNAINFVPYPGAPPP